MEESHNEIISKLIKKRDHVIAKNKVLKNEKVEFGVGHAKLIEDMERVDKAHKALESEHSFLLKSHEQTQLTKLVVASASISSCDHANIIEENARLINDLAYFYSSMPKINDADRKSTRLNSSHITRSRMPSSA